MRFYPYQPRDTPHLATCCQVIDIGIVEGGYFKVVRDNLTYFDAIQLANELNSK
jgi:hypothetical protein